MKQQPIPATLVLEKSLPETNILASADEFAESKRQKVVVQYFGVFVNHERVGEVKIEKEK